MASHNYSDEEKERIVKEAIEHVSGGKTLKTFCEQEGKPNRTTFQKWLKDREDWMQAMQQAREDGVDELVESTLAMLRKQPETDRWGKVDSGWVNHLKVKLDHMMRLASVWSSRYSPKKQVEYSGQVAFQVVTGVPEAPQQITNVEHKVLDVQVGEKADVNADG